MSQDIQQMMSLLGSGKEGIAQATVEAGIAGVLADIINAQRLNTKMMAREHGVDVEASMMTEERAGEILAGAVNRDMTDFALVWDDILNKQDKALESAMGDDWDDFYRRREQALPHIGDDIDAQQDDAVEESEETETTDEETDDEETENEE